MRAAARNCSSCHRVDPTPMPSPIGHALAGISVGLAMAPLFRPGLATIPLPWRAGTSRPGAATFDPRARKIMTPESSVLVLCAIASVAPDLDLLFGTHSTYTHSIGAVALVFLVTLAATSWRVAAAVALAWGSHLLLDWLGNDTRAPLGIMALWPFTNEHYQSSLHLFNAISRRYWMPEQFILGNLKAAFREIAILAPVAWVAWMLGRRHRGATGTGTT